MSDMGRIRFVPVLLFILLPLRALPVVFSGQAPTYAGGRIEFYVSADWFTGSETSLGSCIVGTTGDFSFSAGL
jgi:hypothetical protein